LARYRAEDLPLELEKQAAPAKAEKMGEMEKKPEMGNDDRQ